MESAKRRQAARAQARVAVATSAGMAVAAALFAIAACGVFGTAEDPLTNPPDAPSDASSPEASSSDADLDASLGDGRDGAVANRGCDGGTACERFVFATSETFAGNLGGIAGADAKCQKAADGSTLFDIKGRTFVAWVSTPKSPVKDRLAAGTMRYKRVDGMSIASSYADVLDGVLARPIGLDESGQSVLGAVWTGSDRLGNTSGSACLDWNSNLVGATESGDATMADFHWAEAGPLNCAQPAHLYCFEY